MPACPWPQTVFCFGIPSSVVVDASMLVRMHVRTMPIALEPNMVQNVGVGDRMVSKAPSSCGFVNVLSGKQRTQDCRRVAVYISQEVQQVHEIKQYLT